MNNYNSNNSYVDQPILSESRYIIYNEQNQSQWIDSIAKQAEAGQIIRITKLPKSMQNETILQYPIYVLLNKKVLISS